MNLSASFCDSKCLGLLNKVLLKTSVSIAGGVLMNSKKLVGVRTRFPEGLLVESSALVIPVLNNTNTNASTTAKAKLLFESLELKCVIIVYNSPRHRNADDIASLADALVGLEVDGFVFPKRALAGGGHGRGVGVIGDGVNGQEHKALAVAGGRPSTVGGTPSAVG
jgi:hypothetical protein